MGNRFHKPTLPWLFILLALFICIADGLIENLNGRFWLNDFRVYYSAAQQAYTGAKVYGIPFGLDTGFYKYSPFMLLAFMPSVFISYPAASLVHFGLSSILLVLTFLLLQKIAEEHLFFQKCSRPN